MSQSGQGEQKGAGLLDRVRLERENEALQARLSELTRLLEVAKSLVSVLSLDGVLIRIVEEAVRSTRAEEGVLMLLDERKEELYVKTQKGIGEEHVQLLRMRVSDSLAGRVLKTGKPIRLNRDTKVVTGYTVKSLMYVPIAYRDEILGVLLVDNRRKERAFSDEDAKALLSLAEYAAIAIRNASLVEDLKGQNRLLTGLHQTGRSALSILSIDRVLNQVAESALDVLEADLAVLYEYDKTEDNVILPAIVQGSSLAPEFLQGIGKIVPHKQSIVFRMVRRGRSFFAPRARQDWIDEGLIDVKKQLSTSQLLTHHRAASSAAIVLATGAEILGVLFVHYNTERRFSEEEREIVHMFAEQAAIAIQNARLFTLEQEQIKLLGDLIKRE